MKKTILIGIGLIIITLLIGSFFGVDMELGLNESSSEDIWDSLKGDSSQRRVSFIKDYILLENNIK